MLSTVEVLDSFISAGDTRSRYARRKIMAMTDLGAPSGLPLLNGVAFANCGKGITDILAKGCRVIIIADSKDATTPADIAEHLAKAIYLMDYVERKAVPIVCVDAAVVSKADPAMLEAADIDIAYDPSRACGVGPSIPDDMLKIRAGGKIEWGGAIPRIIMNSIVRDRDRQFNELRSEKIRELLGEFGYVPVKMSVMGNTYKMPMETSSLRELASALTFGNIELPASEQPSYSKKDPNAKWLLEHVVFKKKLWMEESLTEEAFANQLRQIGDTMKIWEHLMAPYQIKFSCNEMGEDAEAHIRELGEWLGADSAIQAYFDGVPLVDIIA